MADRGNLEEWKGRPTVVAVLLLGALVGTIVLGVGGRIGMRIFAVLDGVNPGFSLGGSLTVVFLGAVWGVGGGLMLWLGRRVFPRSPLLRGLAFWGIWLFLTARVLNPLSWQRVLVFGPLAIIYGGVMYRLWCHQILARAMRRGATSLAVESS